MLRSIKIFVSFLFFVLVLSCSSAPKKSDSALRPWQKSSLKGSLEKSVDAFDTTFVIRAWPSSKPVVPLDQAIDLAIQEIRRIAQIADAKVEGSEIALINEKAFREPVNVSDEFSRILMDCERMHQLSKQRFDVTFTAYKNKSEFTDADYNRYTEWDQKGQVGPDAQKLFGDRNLILDLKPSPQVRMYNQRVKLNLNGMMRGYAAERAMKILMKQSLGGFAVIADGFVAAIGTPLRDPQLLCIENPKSLGSCIFQVKPLDPRKILYFGVSASQERPGKMFDPKEIWSLRSGGVIVAGDQGAWVQFGATISGVLDDLSLKSFFSRTQNPKLSGAFFIKDRNAELDGDLSPFISLSPVGSGNASR